MQKEPREDDRNLVEDCIRRDLVAWSKLVSKYSKLVYVSIDNRLKKYGVKLAPHDIEDIRQDVFTMIWRGEKLKDITNTGNIAYWIAVVSGNAAIDHIRKSSARESFKTVSIYEKFRNEKEFAQIIPSRQMRPEDDTAETEMADLIDEAVGRLPSREQLIIKLHLIHDKKFDEISDILGLPKGTVSSYVKRAKDKLKIALKELR